VYAILKYRILTCTLAPNQRLIENEISTEMNISRTPLREALNRLHLEGLVVLTRYRGYAVAPVTLADIRELCEVRRFIEAEAAGLAAERATSAECDDLLSLAELPYTPGERATYDNYLRANTAFHHALARCSHNRRLENMVMSVLDQLHRPLYLGLDVGIEAGAATAEHLQVLEAVRARDAARARCLMTEQISRTEGRIVAALEALGDGWAAYGDGAEKH
jgi:DNA-binding GntR family transcriptional regulator